MNDREVLSRLVKYANRFRNTPIVDDDFPARRDFFDYYLGTATTYLEKERPKIVCLCGSTRFWGQFQEASLRETLAGNIVLSIGAATSADHDDKTFGGLKPASEFEATKKALDQLHFHKIEMADEVLVLNIGGYVGESTRNEIDYAERCEKPIRYLEPI